MQTLDGHSLLAQFGLDHFKTASTFGALSEEAIRFLLTRGRTLAVEDGEELFHPGDASDSFFVVLEGLLDFYRHSGNEEVLVGSVAFGEQLGYISMIALVQRSGVGRARGPAVVLQVDSDVFYQLHVELPFDFGIVMLNLSRDMARKIHVITENFVHASVGHPTA